MSSRAVIFDLDGTLLDTLEDLADAMNAALATLGFPGHPLPAFRTFVGDGVDVFAARALPEGRADPETVSRLVRAMREEYSGRHYAKTRPFPGVPDLLDRLAALEVPCAVLSNKEEETTRETVDTAFGLARFAVVRGARKGVPIKPDPTVALEIARGFGLPADRILYLGDTNTDMRTAVAAGFEPLGALWGFRDAAELTSAGARHLLSHPLDLLRFLEDEPVRP